MHTAETLGSSACNHADTALSLQQLNAIVGNSLRVNPRLQRVWVTAELSDVRYSGGHCYLELLEKNQAGTTVAKLRANIWQSALGPIRAKFRTATGGSDITGGIKVMLQGSVAHHPVYGLSFSVSDIDPSYTLGDMERLRHEIIAKLTARGVIDANRRLPLSPTPQRIAVISSAGAAGYGDFMQQLLSTPEGFALYPVLFQAVMQGEATSASVRAALEKIEMSIDLWDCVVIIRGGGATTDLNGFDDYALAHAVATFPLPIIVGIGHERDRTVLDEIAHTRVKTPTAAAAFIIDRLRAARTYVHDIAVTLHRYVSERLAGEHQRLANLGATLPAAATSRLAATRSALRATASRLPMAASARTASARQRLSSLAAITTEASGRRIADSQRSISLMAEAVADAAERLVSLHSRRLEALGSLVGALDPRNTLRRGYSVTRAGGHAISDPAMIAPGTEIETTLYKGTIRSTSR